MFFFFDKFDNNSAVPVNQEILKIRNRSDVLEIEARLLVLRLIQLRANGHPAIQSITYNGVSLPEIPSLKDVDLSTLPVRDIFNLTKEIGYDFTCQVAGHPQVLSKVNIEVNGNKYGIRCFDHTERPLINHSTRDKFEKLCKRAGVGIEELDDAVDFYWQCREAGIFNEDCTYASPLNPFLEKKEALRKLLTYIAFHSHNIRKEYDAPDFEVEKLDGYIDYTNPIDEKTWDVLDENSFFDKVWTHLRFSFRADRGMPFHGKVEPDDESILKWTRKWKNKKGEDVYKGALHVRICKYDSSINAVPLENLFAVKYQEEIKDVSINIGEKDEYLLKLFLIECRQKSLPIPLGTEIQRVKSVQNPRGEEIDDPAQMLKWNEVRPGLLVYVCTQIKAGKASAFDKSDVLINGIGISVKSRRGQKPTIINQTSREKILRVMNAINSPIAPLDRIVDRYWAFRLSGGPEDVSGIGNNNPFTINEDGDSTLSILKPLLNYFSFRGTGTRDSNAPAKYILSVGNPSDIKTWKYYSEEDFVESVWDKLVFSLRSKGTPKELTNEMLPWVREIDEKKKGALNVRVG